MPTAWHAAMPESMSLNIGLNVDSVRLGTLSKIERRPVLHFSITSRRASSAVGATPCEGARVTWVRLGRSALGTPQRCGTAERGGGRSAFLARHIPAWLVVLSAVRNMPIPLQASTPIKPVSPESLLGGAHVFKWNWPNSLMSPRPLDKSTLCTVLVHNVTI